MKRFLVLALVLAPSVALADVPVWHVAGGLALPPGAAFTFDRAWRLGDSVALGGHGLLLLDVHRETLRMQIGPVVTFGVGPASVVSIGGGIVDAYANTLHTMQGNLTWGATLAFRQGIGESHRTTFGFELNYIPEVLVNRDLAADVGGGCLLFMIGRQVF